MLKKLATTLIELVFGKLETIQHPFFGEMLDAGDYYECRSVFQATANEVEIGLEKTEPGADQNQINFFNELDENYEQLVESIKPSLQEEIRTIIPGYFIDDFEQHFRLDYLWIPKCEVEPYQWEMGFSEIGELQHHCQLKMEGFKVLSIHIDG